MFEELENPRRRNCSHPLNKLLQVASDSMAIGIDDRISVVKEACFKMD